MELEMLPLYVTMSLPKHWQLGEWYPRGLKTHIGGIDSIEKIDICFIAKRRVSAITVIKYVQIRKIGKPNNFWNVNNYIFIINHVITETLTSW